jgi:hypothetical protein
MNKQLISALVFSAAASQVWAQDAALQKCKSDNAKAHQEVVNAYNTSASSSQVTKNELREWTAKRNEIVAKHKEYEKDGITLTECQHMLKDNQSLKALMASFVAPPVMPDTKPEPVKMTAEQKKTLEKCTEDQEKVQKETEKKFSDAKKAGYISAQEEQEYNQQLTIRSNRMKDAKAKGWDHNDCLLYRKQYNAITQLVSSAAKSK